LLDLFAFGDTGWGDEMLAGLVVTIELAAAALPLGLLLGFLAAGATLSRQPWLRAVGTGYTTVLRGLPELLTLFVVYNGLALLINAAVVRWGPEGAYVELSPFVAGVIALGLVFGAYAGEVLRGAFQALSPGQIEAAVAIGMRPAQVFFRIKLPQLWRFALPGLGNLWINLLKDTALVSVIALDDLMRMTRVAVGATKQPFTFFLAACLIYWALCMASEIVLARMERHANRGVRRA
jgi:polar amino acid transport system permease protein